MNTPRLIILDFDGTLFDTHTSIAHCISRTFSQLGQSDPPSASAIRSTIATGVGLEETFQMLRSNHPPVLFSLKPGVNANTSDNLNHTNISSTMSNWIDTYRSFYASEGLPLITPFPGAETLLRTLRQRSIPIVVVSNKGIKAVEAALRNAGMEGLAEMVLGDMPGVLRKPDPMSYFEIIAPRFASRGEGERYGDGGDEDRVGRTSGQDPREVLVVGDTAADIQFARNIGAVACWARYGYGKKEECEELVPDLVVDSLEEVQRFVCGIE